MAGKRQDDPPSYSGYYKFAQNAPGPKRSLAKFGARGQSQRFRTCPEVLKSLIISMPVRQGYIKYYVLQDILQLLITYRSQ